jgi:hypothetical protein
MADFASMITGIAENTNQVAGQLNPVGSVMQGAQLAINKQQLDMQQQQLQMRMQEVQQAKVDRTMGWFEKAANMPEGQVKNAFLKNYIPNGIQALGLNDVFHPDSLKMGQSDPALIAYISDEVKNNRLQPSTLYKAMRDPDTMATLAASDGFKTFGGQQEIAETLQNSIGEIRKAADVAEQNTFKDKELKMRLAEQQQLREMMIRASVGKTEGGKSDKLATEIRTKFQPLAKEEAALGSAQDARDRVQAQLNKDPSGKTVAPQDMGAMVFSLLHSELGRVNSQELSNQLHIPGIENMAEDQLVKVFGGINPNVFPGLAQRVNTAAQELDKQKAQLSQAYQPQIANKPEAAATLSAYQNKVYRPSAALHKMSNGKSYTTEQLQQLRANPNVDPAVAAEIDRTLGSK